MTSVDLFWFDYCDCDEAAKLSDIYCGMGGQLLFIFMKMFLCFSLWYYNNL